MRAHKVASHKSQGHKSAPARLCRRGSMMLEYTVLIIAIAMGLFALRNVLAGAIGGNGRQAGDVFGAGQQEDRPFVR